MPHEDAEKLQFRTDILYIYIKIKRERERASFIHWLVFIFPCHIWDVIPNHPAQHGPGLWDLASAAGQRVNFAALENKVVAVDAA
jgi:hypothetical protein